MTHHVLSGLHESFGADAASRAGGLRSPADDRARLDHLAVLSLFVLWIICNPFFGTSNSSPIYIARAMADLDPSGIGRDFMFRYDGQSAYTLFTPLLRWLTALLGPGNASLFVASASLVAAFLAALAFASALTTGRARWLAVVLLATMPAWYGGGYQLFAYGEPAATPRPFAEAFVLLGLAALLRGRTGLCLGIMILVALIHPIMALAGLGTVAVYLGMENRRVGAWILAVVALAALAGLLGLPPFSRAFQTIDPEWLSTLKLRAPYLFPTGWPDIWIGRFAARVASLLIALRLVSPPVRRLFIAVLAAGFFGLAAAVVFGEKMALLLAVQAQSWRMVWLVCAMALAASAICLVELWPRGGLDRVAVLLLALAWIHAEQAVPGLLLAICALTAFYLLEPETFPMRPGLEKAIVGVLLVTVAVGLFGAQAPLLNIAVSAPSGEANEAINTLAIAPNFIPLAVLAAMIGMSRSTCPNSARGRAGAAAGLVVLAMAAAWASDRRSTESRYFDSGAGADDLRQALAARPGEIFWIDGQRESWEWLHRPNWLTQLQGAAVVFSRDLAVTYRRRSEAAMAAGLASPAILSSEAFADTCAPANLTRANIATFCSGPEAPGWIVAPLVDDSPLPDGLNATEWTAPFTKLSACRRDDLYVWRHRRRYALIPCG